MKSFRENPDGEENQKATRQHEREVFAAKMEAKRKDVYGCIDCGEENEPVEINGCPTCPDCGSQKLTGPV